MAVREGLLALLSDKPRHGYELRAEFEARTAELWRLNSGQVYTTLDRLQRDGLVDADDGADPSGRRRLYKMTEAGRTELRSWLDGSSWTAEPQRDELLMKVLLAADDPALAATVIADHRHALLARLQQLRRDQRDTPDAPDDHLAHHLVTDALVARLEADLHWLERCEQRLARRTETS